MKIQPESCPPATAAAVVAAAAAADVGAATVAAEVKGVAAVGSVPTATMVPAG